MQQADSDAATLNCVQKPCNQYDQNNASNEQPPQNVETYPTPPMGTPLFTMPPDMPVPGKSELILALVFLAMGFCFWEWSVLWSGGSGLGGFLVFVISTVAAFGYVTWRGVRQTPLSCTALAVVLLGALPFLLYDQRDISILNFVFEMGAFVLWLAFCCKTTISARLSGFLVGDIVRQLFAVPFGNFARLFTSLRRKAVQAPQPTKPLAKPNTRFHSNRPASKSLLLLFVGLLVSLPLIAAVVTLLMAADENFGILAANLTHSLNDLIKNFTAWIDLGRLPVWCLQFVLGIPVACYVFGAVYGNVHRRKTKLINKESADRTLANLHVLPCMTLYGVLALLVALYLTFFIVMGGYLFSALAGCLPGTYTYAQYARSGFFELCGIASINLAMLLFIYLFARRRAHEYPRLLRALTGALTLATCLLIVTALSKMLLYIATYDLTRLRLYTLWFMVLLLLTFLVLLVWHVHPFNAGRVLVAVPLVCCLALFLTNTDGIIARYNTTRYLTGQTQEIDVETVGRLSNAALPSLYELRDSAPNAAVRERAQTALAQRERNPPFSPDMSFTLAATRESRDAWYNWTFQTPR